MRRWRRRVLVLEQFEVNVVGMMDVTRAVLPHVRANRSEVIVNVSSGAGVFALPMISLYGASKFALEGFSESLSYELSGLGISVKSVEPGGVVSEYLAFIRAGRSAAAGRQPGRGRRVHGEVRWQRNVKWNSRPPGQVQGWLPESLQRLPPLPSILSGNDASCLDDG
ncbi:SDR family NAD(P)-dependent oxidoreductase [Azospirillum aestuarii]|uniref:SDR family NAD(P)-dependent oxidoreductase n=1 Tax=Azospirillum aestuarii TaxID=2802052 RepID=UPI004054BA15